jgi:hypothetical protein
MLLRINDEITAAIVGVWDEQQQWHGHLRIGEARALARTAGRDLVEFAPKTQPPTCRIADAGDYRAIGLARDLANAGLVTNADILRLIARYEEKGIRSGHLLLLNPADAIRFAQEAAVCDIGTTGPNYWYGPGLEWYPAPNYSALVGEPDFVQRSLAQLTEEVNNHLPADVAFVEVILYDPMKSAHQFKEVP